LQSEQERATYYWSLADKREANTFSQLLQGILTEPCGRVWQVALLAITHGHLVQFNEALLGID
jgi:hypothetical protein